MSIPLSTTKFLAISRRKFPLISVIFFAAVLLMAVFYMFTIVKLGIFLKSFISRETSGRPFTSALAAIAASGNFRLNLARISPAFLASIRSNAMLVKFSERKSSVYLRSSLVQRENERISVSATDGRNNVMPLFLHPEDFNDFFVAG